MPYPPDKVIRPLNNWGQEFIFVIDACIRGINQTSQLDLGKDCQFTITRIKDPALSYTSLSELKGRLTRLTVEF